MEEGDVVTEQAIRRDARRTWRDVHRANSPLPWERVAAVVLSAVTRVRATVDGWDAIATLGLLLLAAGLWLWLSLGVALTVAGTLLIALGVSGARAPKPPASGRGG